MNEVVPDAIAAIAIIAPGVDRAHVASFKRDMMYLVEFYEVIIAGKQNRAMRVVVNEVARSPQPDPLHEHRGHVAFGPPPLSLEMTAFNKMPRRRECLTVPAAQRYTAIPGVEDMAVADSMTETSINC